MGRCNFELGLSLVVLHVVNAHAGIVGATREHTGSWPERQRVYTVAALILSQRIFVSVLNQLHQSAVVTCEDQLPVGAELTTSDNIVEASGELRRRFQPFKVYFFLTFRLKDLVEVQVRADSYS